MKNLLLLIIILFMFNLTHIYSQSFSAKTDFTTGTYPRSVSIGDLNGDGKPDLAVANASSNSVSVFFNTTTIGATPASFSAKTDFTTGTAPYSVSIGDLNGDGKPDLAVANNSSNSVSVFFNTTTPGAAAPSFSAKTDFTTGTAPLSVSIGDLNGDGKPDLAVANYSSTSVSVFFNTTTPGAASPSFSTKADFTTGTKPYSVSIGDLNGDGKPDLAVANNGSSTVSVFFNTTTPGAATPTFSAKTDFTTGTTPVSVSISDLNGDGKPDLAAANYNSNSVSVFFNTTTPGAAAPTFSAKTDFTTGTNPRSVSIGDLNGDGKPDLAAANYNSTSVSVFFNTTTIGATPATFSAKTDFTSGYTPYSVSIGELNGDGKPDLAVANYSSNSVSVFFNTTTPGAASPTFSAKTDFTTAAAPISVSIGDLNGDGKPDLAVANSGSATVSVFFNTTTPGAATPTFSAKTDFTTAATPLSVSIGDLNGDGKPDLAVANNGSSTVSVFFNITAPGAASPSFSAKTDFTAGTGPSSVSIGDLNGDGKPDIAVANFNSNSVSIFFNTTTPGAASPTFSAKTDFTTGSFPYSVSIGDLNGDGKPDMAVANYGSNSVSVFLNTTTPGAAAPTFSAKTDFTAGTNPSSVSISDLNGDGEPDLAVANNGSSTVSVFLNTTTPGAASPSFSAKTDFTVGTAPYSVSISDFNGDGKPDLAVANSNSYSVSVLLNSITLPLPVELTTFSASVFGSSVNLSWNTATEVNNYGFEIERSSVEKGTAPSLRWSKIGFVPGFGTSNTPHNYSFTDNSLLGGEVFSYRLKQIDVDGKFKYSDVLTISLVVPEKAQLLQNSPNPFNPSTSIKFFVPDNMTNVTIKVYDMLGKEVTTLINNQLQAGFHIVFWNGRDKFGNSEASGEYLYRLSTNNFAQTKKMILLK